MTVVRALVARTVSGSGGWSRECPAACSRLAFERTDRPPVLGCGVARNRIGHRLSSGLPAVASLIGVIEEVVVFTIGIDPHKGSHLAAVLDQHEQFVDEFRVRADRPQRDRLLKFAAPYRRGVGDRRARPASARCWRSNSSRRVRRCWMCRRSCRRGCGCSTTSRGQERHPRRAFGRDRRDPQPAARRRRREPCGGVAPAREASP